MAIEHKFMDLAGFKAIADGAGGFEGYASVFSELDDVGDIVLPGAYTDTLPEFLQKGFAAHSHDWSINGVVGYPVGGAEDQEGLYLQDAFHSTPDAQSVRVKAQERLAAGKQVSLSIGYDLAAPPIIIRREQYAEELPKYLRSDKLQEGLAKAQRFEFVRLLTKLRLYEHSIVTVPALQSARVTMVKSADVPDGTDSPLLADGATFAQEGETVLAAVKAYAERAKDVHALRAQEKRRLSAAARERLISVRDALKPILAEIEEVLEASEPDDGKAARQEAARKAHIAALVQEALRQQGAYANGN